MISCPKCRSTSLTVHEYFELSSQIHFTDGKVDFTYGNDGGGRSLNKFDGVCDDCGHTWWLRYATGQRAIEAADDFERIT